MLRAEGFDPIALDVTDSASIAAAANAVLARFDNQLGAIVNNAGFGLTSAIEDAPRSMLRDIFEVNVFGLQELTSRFIPLFRKQGYGRIVNVSSVLGELSLPFAGVYSASKFAIEALSDALRRELFDSGVAVSIIQPGPIETKFSENLAHRTERYSMNPNSPFTAFYRDAIETRKTGTAHHTAEAFTKPPETVAEKIFQCLESSRPPIRARVTVVAYFGAFVRRALPAALIDAVMISKLKKRLNFTLLLLFSASAGYAQTLRCGVTDRTCDHYPYDPYGYPCDQYRTVSVLELPIKEKSETLQPDKKTPSINPLQSRLEKRMSAIESATFINTSTNRMEIVPGLIPVTVINR